MKVKVHRIVLMVIDHDDLGAEGVRREIENVRYPNRCISPLVMGHDTVEVKYTDSHELNHVRKRFQAFVDLFKEVTG